MFEKIRNLFLATPDHTNDFFSADINSHKAVAAAAYILFFVPLVTDPSSAYARFHANQGLLLFILSIISGIIGLIPIIGTIVSFILGIAILIMLVLGIVNGSQGRAKELPFIGGIKILTK